MHLQRPARRPAARAAAAAAGPAQEAEHLDEEAEPDADELLPLLLDEDDAEAPVAPVEAAAPGFTQFGQFPVT